MIKKISILLVFICLLMSCGKKGDPEYIETTQKTEKSNDFKNKLQ